ncbi:MAG: tetratricopeptide repeat protein [Fibrobacteria bacterium]|nr:tetratricopeptide repeat protein [Fibrobacteria bacterium]
MSNHFFLAEALFRQSKYSESLEHLKKAIEDDPTNPVLFAFRGLCLLKAKMYSESERSLEESLALDPNNDFAYYVYASLSLNTSHYKLAEEKINSAIDINPINAEYYGVLALCLYNRHAKLETIRKIVKQGLSFDPHNNMCKNVLSMVEIRQGKSKLASDILDFHLENDPTNSLSLVNQGWNFLHRGEYKQALNFFNTALEYEPGNSWAKTGKKQALKARMFFYRPLLKYFLMLSRMSPAKRFLWIFGIYIVFILISRIDSPLGITASVLAIAYAGFVFLTWLGDSLASAMLIFSKEAKGLFTKEEKRNTFILAGSLLTTGLCIAAYVISRKDVFLFCAAGLFLLSIPLNTALQDERPRRRRLAFIFIVIIVISGAVVLTTPFYMSEGFMNSYQSLMIGGYLLVSLSLCSILYFIKK